jgi:signal recognition particle receptor subunit beta
MKAVIGHAHLRQVAFVGPFGVGKTTAVRSLSDIPVVNTDVLTAVGSLPRPGSPRKRTTTVGLDYGEWHRSDGSVVCLVGTPGQERFVTVRRSAMPRSTSIVLWLFGDQSYAVEEADEWMGYLGDSRTWARMTLAVTRSTDSPDAPALDDYVDMLRRYDPSIPVVAADPRVRADVKRTVLLALRAPLRVTA